MTAVFGASAVLATWYGLTYCVRPPGLAKSVIKTGSVAGLGIVALWSGASLWLVVALFLGAWGDFFLSRSGRPAFLAGLVGFAFAHLTYAVLFRASGAEVVLTPATILIAGLAVVMAAVLYRHAGPLRWPVVGYVGIIAVMAVLALGLPAPLWLAMIAAMSFVVLDSVLGLELFVLSDRHPLRRFTPYVVWSTYWGAQAMFLVAFGGLWAV